MVFKNLCILVLWTKVASALEWLETKGKGKGIQFTVLYPPKCSQDLLSLAGLHTQRPFQHPRDIPEQMATYSVQALKTAL